MHSYSYSYSYSMRDLSRIYKQCLAGYDGRTKAITWMENYRAGKDQPIEAAEEGIRKTKNAGPQRRIVE